jgi:hypothetical protein
MFKYEALKILFQKSIHEGELDDVFGWAMGEHIHKCIVTLKIQIIEKKPNGEQHLHNVEDSKFELIFELLTSKFDAKL